MCVGNKALSSPQTFFRHRALRRRWDHAQIKAEQLPRPQQGIVSGNLLGKEDNVTSLLPSLSFPGIALPGFSFAPSPPKGQSTEPFGPVSEEPSTIHGAGPQDLSESNRCSKPHRVWPGLSSSAGSRLVSRHLCSLHLSLLLSVPLQLNHDAGI